MSKFRRFMTARSVGNLILRIVIMLAIPYAYLMICGLIFDKWLHLYTATSFIFWSLMAFWAAELVLCILSIVWYCKAKKGGARKAAGKKKEKKTEKTADKKADK